jgi:hypothetical protein
MNPNTNIDPLILTAIDAVASSLLSQHREQVLFDLALTDLSQTDGTNIYTYLTLTLTLTLTLFLTLILTLPLTLTLTLTLTLDIQHEHLYGQTDQSNLATQWKKRCWILRAFSLTPLLSRSIEQVWTALSLGFERLKTHCREKKVRGRVRVTVSFNILILTLTLTLTLILTITLALTP